MALFNLIPAFPLDGGRIFRSIVWLFGKNMLKATRIAVGLGTVLSFLAIGLGFVMIFVQGDLWGLWLIFLGWMINQAGQSSYSQLVFKETFSGMKVKELMSTDLVTVSPDDPILDKYRNTSGALAGLAFQRDMERRAAAMGGGNMTVPVQRLTDFLSGKPSVSAPSSSYRLGVKPAPCHEIYPEPLTASLKHALVEVCDKQMPGYVCDDGLLHAVETRTSSPVRIARDPYTLSAIGINNLFPAGEGAGFAGGIVSAAVDGLAVADAVLRFFSNATSTNVDDRQLYQSKGDTFY
jgi:hypothetical protein